jgi:sigma-B regulation protein RsbU (phosphoserine phosphatase)
MKGSLARRLVVWIGFPVGVLFVLAAWYGATRSFQRVEADTEQWARLTARYQAERIEESMNGWKQIPTMMALILEQGKFQTEPELEAWLKTIVQHNNDIWGSCIAFEPEAFTPGKRLYAPYWHWQDKEVRFVQVGNPTYDYFKWPWYQLPTQTGRKLWVEPFFDEGGGDVMMTTYCVPFRRDGKIWGVATVDVALTQLVKETLKAPVGRDGYVLMVSQGGRFLICPDESKVMNTTVQSIAPELGRQMTAGEDGLIRMRDPFRGRASFVAFAPILHGTFSLAVVIPESEAMQGAWELVAELAVIGLIGLAGMLAGLWLIARSIVRPITTLANATRTVGEGRLDFRMEPGAATDEVRELTVAFSRMTHDLRKHIEELRHATALKERLEAELDAARTSQMGLVPQSFPAFPERPEIDLHGLVLPAREVGGDLCNFFFIDERHLAVVVGDVAGKGVPAALFMAVTTSLLKATSRPGRSPAEIMTMVNHELYEEASAGVFVTLIYALLDTVTGELEFCSAGHPPPLVVSVSGNVRGLERASGPACAILPDFTFSTTRTRLAPGETVVFFTDGVTEAMNANKAFFSQERLEAELRRIGGRAAAKFTADIIDSVRQFADSHEQFDDITLVALRWLGPASINLAASISGHVSSAAKPAPQTQAATAAN